MPSSILILFLLVLAHLKSALVPCSPLLQGSSLPEPWSPTPSTTSGCAAAIAPPSPSFIMCVSGLRAEDFCLSGKHRSLLCLLAEAEISPGGLLPYPGSPLPFLAKQLARTSGSLEPVAAIRRKPGRSTASHALPANVKLESSNLPTPFSMSVTLTGPEPVGGKESRG